MKTSTFSFLVFLIYLLSFKAFSQFEELNNIDNIYGIWNLKTIPVTKNASISLPTGSPIAALSFEKCNDSLEIYRFPPNVKDLRAKDIFRNIRTIELDTTGTIIDTAYWVIQLYDNCPTMFVSSYGKKIKKYFTILHFANDSLISTRNEVYIKNTVSDSGTKKSVPQKTQKAKKMH